MDSIGDEQPKGPPSEALESAEVEAGEATKERAATPSPKKRARLRVPFVATPDPQSAGRLRWLWAGMLVCAAFVLYERLHESLFPGGPERPVPYPSVEHSGNPTEGQDWTAPGIGMEFVWMAAMECWVGKYEVTNGEYRECKREHDSWKHEGHSLNGDRQPVVQISHKDAVSFAEWLTEGEREAGRLPDGLRYRLPDGEEWSAFAECGDGREYPWGNEWPPRCGNYWDETGRKAAGLRSGKDGYDDGFPVTCPVERSGKNDWGLYGVGGNVWELTSTYVGHGYTVRGAPWTQNSQRYLRCEHYSIVGPAVKDVGFRLLLSR